MRSPEGGRLLDKVAYCMRQPCKATNIVDEKIEVRDTFPYNPGSKTAPETARQWASGYYYGEDKGYVPEVVVTDNEPFTITITDLHVRSEGGRAYKVIDNEMRRFDLREDQVLEVMKRVGILPMGIVPGTFVWGILGSQVRLVLVDGTLHKAMTRGAQDKKEFERAQSAGEHPTEATLVPGRIYRKRDKSIHAFLGKVKRSGNDKVLYAFIQMPTKEAPEQEDDADIDAMGVGSDPAWEARWKKSRKYDREVARKWSILTWRERCKFAWDDAHNLFRGPGEQKYVYYESIVLMSSPKFQAEVGELETDLFEELKANKDRNHDYADGHGNSILEVEFKRAHPGERGYLAVGDTWQSYADGWGQPDNSPRMTEAWHKHKSDFHAGLVGL